nr:MAG TPA: hypothetical protein [Caudoviricetes sp.]
MFQWSILLPIVLSASGFLCFRSKTSRRTVAHEH